MLPEFQRDFRWELDKTYDLFDSLIRDIFIGTVIYGKPTFEMTLREIDKRPRKGKGSHAPLKTINYTTEEISKRAQTDNLRIVLDGQQRITSIYRAIVVGLDDVFITLREDIDIEDIAQLTLEEMLQDITGEESPSSISIKLSDAYRAEKEELDDEDLNDMFMKTLYARQAFLLLDESQQKNAAKIYRRTLRKIISLYNKQKLVSFYLLEMSLKKFCVFFERSNSRGIQLNFTDILAAKLYHGFNLRKKVEEFESQTNNIRLNREIIVRAIAYIVGAEKNGPISVAKDFILEHLEASDFNMHWDVTCQLYTASLKYLANQHYILSQAWMPSENMIIPVMMFLRQIKSFDRMNHEQQQFFEFWYWSSIFSNRYSTSSNETIIIDSTILTKVAQGERISIRNYFSRLRSLVTEPEDLFSYTKRSSVIYRGILNLLGYAAQGLKDWNSTQKIDITMQLEDHHIYPRAYISSKPNMDGMKQSEAEQLVDCVVNRTLIPKLLNVTIGKKAPSLYLTEIQQNKNSKLAECLTSHLVPEEMISDTTWDSLFNLFLKERAQKIFNLIDSYTTKRVAEMTTLHGLQVERTQALKSSTKARLKDMIASNKVSPGDRVFTLKQPTQFATIIDGDTVEFEGQQVSINTWGQQMTGWSSINIYAHVHLERTGLPLESLRELNWRTDPS
jgi:hypothetical protein